MREKNKILVGEVSSATHICRVLGPPTCGDHNVLGSQDCLIEREGKSICSYPYENKEMSNGSKWSLQYFH